MSLVTDAEVKAIIDTSRDTSPFIVTADLLVSELAGIQALSTARQKQIELYLAAHFVALSEEKGNLVRHTKGEATEVYKMQVGHGLELTRYGQQAVSLDTSGSLKTLNKKGQDAQFRIV